MLLLIVVVVVVALEEGLGVLAEHRDVLLQLVAHLDGLAAMLAGKLQCLMLSHGRRIVEVAALLAVRAELVLVLQVHILLPRVVGALLIVGFIAHFVRGLTIQPERRGRKVLG